MADTTYYVWRRSDGYVSCTSYDPRQWRSKDAFEILLETDDFWDKANPLVIKERAKMDNPRPWEGV